VSGGIVRNVRKKRACRKIEAPVYTTQYYITNIFLLQRAVFEIRKRFGVTFKIIVLIIYIYVYIRKVLVNIIKYLKESIATARYLSAVRRNNEN